MPLFRRKATLLAKIESVYGSDSVPTGVANAILVSDLNINPMDMKTEDRALIRPFIGNSEQLPVGVSVKADFTVEIAGSGSLGVAPAWGPLIRAVGFAEIVTPSTKVEYSPVSANFESVTLYFNLDGVLHKITGARGTVSLGLTRDKRPAFKFVFTGVFNAVTDATSPTLTLTAWKTPLPVSKTNTPTFSLHGYAAVMHELTLDMANNVVYRELINGTAGALITDRKPAGSVVMEAVTVATKDWWTSIKNVTTGALQLIHGTTAGNKVQIDAPNVQLINPQYQDQDGIAMLQCGLVYAPGASGNDEIKISVI